MNKYFEDTVAELQSETDAKITVEIIGKRPCAGEYDEAHLEAMFNKCAKIAEKYNGGRTCTGRSGSTDCNIPMSLGIPALCIGVYIGASSHTREEWVDLESLPTGLKIATELLLTYFD